MGNYTTLALTTSPETGTAVPVVISWWSHPEPEHPRVRADADMIRDMVRRYRMNEHMRHYLTDRDGERTVLNLSGESAQVLHHPLSADFGDFPVAHPVPEAIGAAMVTADVGMYVLVAVPVFGEASMHLLSHLPVGDFGTARIGLRSDHAARERYGVRSDGRGDGGGGVCRKGP